MACAIADVLCPPTVDRRREKWRQISIGEKVPSDSCGRVDIVQRRSKSHPGEIPSKASAWAARRVGDKLERNPRRLNPRNRVEGARQERVADINDALEVEQYAADGAKAMPPPVHLVLSPAARSVARSAG
jgi:hypothetical protein